MGYQQGQPPQWPPPSGQPPNWNPQNQGWGSPQQPPQQRQPQPNTPYPPQWQPRPPYPQQPYQSPPTYYPQQQYYQPMPPPMMPPPPPKKKHTAWIVIAVIVGLLTICGLVGNAINPQSSTTATATTSDVQPTDTPTPTPTPLTNSDDIKSELQSDANSTLTGDNITADYGVQLSKGVIFETTSSKQPLSFIQSECFNMQKTVWQDQQLSIKILDFAIATVNGQFPDVYGECVLDSNSANKIDWNTTNAVTAWNNKVYQNMTPSN